MALASGLVKMGVTGAIMVALSMGGGTLQLEDVHP